MLCHNITCLVPSHVEYTLKKKKCRFSTIWSQQRHHLTLISPGGGEFHCMHIGYVPQTRPPFSAMNYSSGAYLFRSITILHFFGGFCRSGDHHSQNFKKKKKINPFIASHGRGSARSAAPRLSGRSRDSHFQAFGSAAG